MVRSSLSIVVASLYVVGCSGAHAPTGHAAQVEHTPRGSGSPTVADPPRPALRLPRHFLPTSYAARLEIDPARDGFVGSIAITGVIDRPSAVVWLHGRGLRIARAVATRGATEDVLAVTSHGDDLLELRPTTALAPGTWTLTLDYAGAFDLVSTVGAYKQTLTEGSYVYTQLEAVYARRVFPCFDEPDNKVPWQLTLDVPATLVAVGNAPVAREAPLPGGRKRVEFAPTRPLPTYLVAFGVGPFEIVEAGTTAHGTPIRVLALAGRAAEARYAATTAVRLVELVEAWFGTPYPYAKLDLLAIPLTIGFGAMENAGLITFTETLILLGPTASRARERAWVTVAAHEIAHQWFGNLVTMAYWDDIWLNEGFASWLAPKISAEFEPSWHDELGALDRRNTALAADRLSSARKIRQPIVVADDILNAFDRITYDKGASVLAMFEGYLGAEVFQRGVRGYLKAKAWGNATSADFAAAMSEAAGRDLGPAFASFLDHAGAPELSTSLRCAADGARLSLHQQRYVPPGAPAAAGGPWIMPVCVAYDQDGTRAQACTLLDRVDATLALPAKACPRWVMTNVDGRGYYRDPATIDALPALRDRAWPQLSWTERRTVFHDVAEGARTGRVPVGLAMSFVPKLLAGGDRFSIGAALALPVGFDAWIPEALRPRYEAWLRTTYGPAAARIGLAVKPGDSLDVEATRGGLFHAVGWIGRDPKVVAQAVKLATGWRDLPQGIRGLVLQLAVDARPALFDQIVRDVRTETDRTRRREMFVALGAVRDPKRQDRALALVIDPQIDARETLPVLFGSTDEAGGARARQFFRAHAAEILRRQPHDTTTGSVGGLSWLFTRSCRADERDQIVAYVTQTFSGFPGAARDVQQRVEALDQCLAARARVEPEFRAWLGTPARSARPPRR